MQAQVLLCHIKQTGQSTTWKRTCIEFWNYADCRFWGNIYKIYWSFRSVRITSWWKPSQWLSMIVVISSNKYIYKIYKGREMHRCYVQADTLLFICYFGDLNLKRRYRYEDINILGRRYAVFLDSTLGAKSWLFSRISL